MNETSRKRQRFNEILENFSYVVDTGEGVVIKGEAESTNILIKELDISTKETDMIRTLVLERARRAWPELRLSYDPNEEFWVIYEDAYDKNFRSMRTLSNVEPQDWSDFHAYEALKDFPRYFIYMKDLEDIDPINYEGISDFLTYFETEGNNTEKIELLVEAWVDDQKELIRKAKDRLSVTDLSILIRNEIETLDIIPVRDPIILQRLIQNFANKLFSIRENYISSQSEKFMQQFEIMEFISEHLDMIEKIKLDVDIVRDFEYVRMFMETRRKIMDPEFRDGLFYAREESIALASAFRRGEMLVPKVMPLGKMPFEIIKLIMQWRIHRSKDDPFPVTTIEESKMIKSLLLFKDLADKHTDFTPIPAPSGIYGISGVSKPGIRYVSVSRWNGWDKSPWKTTTVLVYLLDDTLGYEYIESGRTRLKPEDFGWPDILFGNRLGKVIGEAVNDASTALEIMSRLDKKEMLSEKINNTVKVLRSLASTSKAELLNQLEFSKSFFILGAKYYGKMDIEPIKETYGESKEDILRKLGALLDDIVERATSSDKTLDRLELINVHKKNVIDGYGYRFDRIMNALVKINDIELQIDQFIPNIEGSKSEASIRKRALYKSISMRANPLSSKTMSSPKMKSLDWDFFF
jgi:hypothetical protein